MRGMALLADSVLNKDAGFTDHERDTLGLRGLLPPRVMDIEAQVSLELEHMRRKADDLERYIGLAALQDRNETLFHRVLGDNLEELLPIVYTPTVGRACQEFSHLYRRPRGVWITPDDVDRVSELLRHAARDEIRLIVVTDNERILGLGDQGAGGMGIPIGKLALYSAAAGIHPGLTLPVSLDVGTDREELLADPLYVGWRHPRLRGVAYDAVVEAFVAGVREVHPRAVLQWEDFKQHNAIRLLERYRNWVCSFNDDIQGTAAIAVAAILTSLRASGQRLPGARVVLAGAGAAGTGIARLLRVAMVDEGVAGPRTPPVSSPCSTRRACSSWVVRELDEDKRDAAMPREFAASLGFDPATGLDLEAVIRAFRPSVLVGTTGSAGAFTEAVIGAMAEAVERPIIMPLSNPTANTEARPPTSWRGATVGRSSPPAARSRRWRSAGVPNPIPQANNAYVFPGIGLGAIVGRGADPAGHGVPGRGPAARRDGDAGRSIEAGGLFPPLSEMRMVAREIAIAWSRTSASWGSAGGSRREQIPAAVRAAMWRPDYVAYEAG